MTTETLVENTKIAVQNAANELPQFGADIAGMASDLDKVQHPKLCLHILKTLEAMYEGRHEAF